MSNERHETVADIVRKMRTLGRLDEKSTDKIPRSLQALGLRIYADRIEAAYKRIAIPTPDQWTEIARQSVEIADLERENASLRAALKSAMEKDVGKRDFGSIRRRQLTAFSANGKIMLPRLPFCRLGLAKRCCAPRSSVGCTNAARGRWCLRTAKS